MNPKERDVSDLLAALDHPRRKEIEFVRKLILGLDDRIRETVKWNAPSYFIREHFATFRLAPGDTLQLVLHTGAKAKSNAKKVSIDDPEGLLKWAANDRCVATLGDMRDIRAKESALVSIVRQWIDRTSP